MNMSREIRFGPLSPGELEELKRLRRGQNPRKYGPPGHQQDERPHVYDHRDDTEPEETPRGHVEVEILNASEVPPVGSGDSSGVERGKKRKTPRPETGSTPDPVPPVPPVAPTGERRSKPEYEEPEDDEDPAKINYGPKGKRRAATRTGKRLKIEV